MDRPVSAASSPFAASTTSGPTHKRNASTKSISRPLGGPTVIPLFVTNLRLLNLDLLPDWPGITPASFSNHDARTRIKCTEYALYQLWKLYDSYTTADKLQPFFPPLEPLQSVNLRAALYRCLNDLKKNGGLPKDTVLRKSMLDDCQGDKFWEVCLAFSTLVLRRATLERKAKYGRPAAERIGTAHGVSQWESRSMLPLALAHKAALRKVLEEKRRKRDTYVTLHNLLAEKAGELKQRTNRSRENVQKLGSLQTAKTKAVETAIEKSWVGSTELRDALVDGDTCAKGDGILVESFDHLWAQADEQGLTVSNGADVGLLQSLSSRATQQSVRLRMWQKYLDRLVATKPATRANSAGLESQTSMPRFDRHRGINLKDTASEDGDDEDDDEEEKEREATEKLRQKQRKPATVSRYDEILTAMREELRKNSSYRNSSQPPQAALSPLKRAHTTPVPMRKPSLALDTSTGAQDPSARSPSQTAVPVRPRMGKRLSSQSKTYEKPKVDSQREPIPLKSELFSPLKENRRSNTSLSSVSLALPTPVEEAEVVGSDVRPLMNGKRHEPRLKDDVDSGIDLHAAHDSGVADALDDKDASSARSSVSTDKDWSVTLTSDFAFKKPALPAEQRALRPSLAERTRRSIAFNSLDDMTSLLPDHDAVNRSETKASDHTTTNDEVPTTVEHRNTLLERTRESISVAPAQQEFPRSKKPSHTRSRSSLYPVNQFETPKKNRSSTVGMRDFTPMEQLMSPDAEYESVFKSRPKIALSPILSPYRDAEANGNGSFDSDAGASSPLAEIGSRA